MKEEELLIQINDEITKAIGWSNDEVHSQISEAYDYYYRHKPLPSKDGFSTFVSGDVFDAVESNVVPLIETFTSNKQAVTFSAVDASVDPTLMGLATDEVNRVILKENNGYEVIHDFIKDGLLCKNGIVKSYWLEEFKRVTVDIIDLDDVALDLLLRESDVDPDTLDIERKEIVSASHIDGSVNKIHVNNGVIDKLVDVSRVVWENVPPEEFIVGELTRNLKMPSFAGQRKVVTISELYDMFPDKEETIESMSSSDDLMWNDILLARHGVDSSYFDGESINADGNDPLQRRVWIYEVYLESSLITGEESKLYQVWTDRSNIFSYTEVTESPYATWTPITVAHKFYGLSLADVTMDVQDAKTHMMRGQLDHMRLVNHPRMMAVKGAYDVRSLMDNRAGVIVEVNEQGAIAPMPSPLFPQASFGMIDLMDQVKAERTGMTKASKGIDDQALSNSKSGVQLDTVIASGEIRSRGMARNFAKMGLSSVMNRVYSLLRHFDKSVHYSEDLISEENPKGEWVWSDLPDNIYAETSVALGRNAQAEEANWKMQQLNFLTEKGLSTPEKSLNTMEEVFRLSGEMDTDRYLPTPEELEQAQAEQAKKAATAEQEAKQVTTPMEEAEMKNRTYELEIKKMDAQAKIASLELEQARLEKDVEEMRLNHTAKMMQIQLDNGKVMVENKVALEKSSLDIQKFALDIEVAKQEAQKDSSESAQKTDSSIEDVTEAIPLY